MPSKAIVVVSPTSLTAGAWLYATRGSSLQHVANRPIVCHVLDALAAADVTEVALVAPRGLSREIVDCVTEQGPPGLRLTELAYDRRAHPEQTLRAAVEFAADAPLILHRADGLLGQPLAPLLEVLELERSEMLLLVAQGSRNSEPLGLATRRLLSVTELDPSNSSHGMAGVCLLGPGVLARVAGEAGSHELELSELAERVIVSDCSRVHVRVVREWRRFSGNARDLLDMNRALLDTLHDRTPILPDNDNRFEGPVSIDLSAIVSSSVICGPVVIGPGAYVADSYIGPHTAIGEGARIEGVEIERSIVLAGASILHVGGRLVASVVGRDARIFRDFSVPRAMRLQVGDGDEVALC